MIVIAAKDTSPAPQPSLSQAQGAGYFRFLPREILLMILAKIMIGPSDISWKAFRTFTLSCRRLAGPTDNRLYSDPTIVERTNDFILRLYLFYHHTSQISTYPNIDWGFTKTFLAIEQLVQNSSTGLSRISFRGLQTKRWTRTSPPYKLICSFLKNILDLAVNFPESRRLKMIDLSKSFFDGEDFRTHFEEMFYNLASTNPVEVKFRHQHLLITPDKRTYFTKMNPVLKSSSILRHEEMSFLFLKLSILDASDAQALTSSSHATNLTSLSIQGLVQLRTIQNWKGLTNLVNLKINVLNDRQNPAIPLFFQSVVLTNLQAVTLKCNNIIEDVKMGRSLVPPVIEEIDETLQALRTSTPHLTKLRLLNISEVPASHFAQIAAFSRLVHLGMPCHILSALKALTAVGLHSRLRSLQLYSLRTHDRPSWDSSLSFPLLERLDIPSYKGNEEITNRLIKCTPQLYHLTTVDVIQKGARLAYLKQVVSTRAPKSNSKLGKVVSPSELKSLHSETHAKKRKSEDPSGQPYPKNRKEESHRGSDRPKRTNIEEALQLTLNS